MMWAKKITLFLFLCCLGFSLKAQEDSLARYAHQLFFNIFKEKPDTAISDFLKRNVPAFYEKKTGTAHTRPATAVQYEIHSFLFRQHPYFNAVFTVGKLELYCQHDGDAGGAQIYDVKLWFEFDKQAEAEMAFSKLVETLIPFSTEKQFSSSNGAQKAEFTDSKGEKGLNRLRVRLTPDPLDKRRLRILVELQNDLL